MVWFCGDIIGLDEERVKEFFFESLKIEEVKNKFNEIYHVVIVISQSSKIHTIINLQNLVVYRDEEKITNIFIYILLNSILRDSIKKDIIKFLFYCPHIIDEKLINTFFEIIKNDKIHSSVREFITNLLISLAQYEPSILNTVEKLAHDDGLKTYIAKYIGWCQIKDMKYINILEILLRDTTLDEVYREGIFKTLVSLSESESTIIKNKSHIDELLLLFKNNNDVVLMKLYSEEKRKKEEAPKWKEDYALAKRESYKQKALMYVGGKAIYPPKFNKNEKVTKEAILIKLEEAREYNHHDMEMSMNTFVKYFLNSIVKEHQDILLEIIDDKSICIENKYDIIKILSKNIKKNSYLHQKIIELYYFYSKKCNPKKNEFGVNSCSIKRAIINSLISINEVDFFINILEQKKHTDFEFKDIVEHLLRQGEVIEDRLIEISIKNKDFFNNFIIYRDIKLLFKAYDKRMNVLEEIKNKALQNGIPLYISKDKRLCVIKDGEKIESEREIDESILNIFPKAKEVLNIKKNK